MARIDISVIPAKAGIQRRSWIPASAGMTNNMKAFNIKISNIQYPIFFILFFTLCSLFFAAAVSAVEIVNLPNPLGTTDISTLTGRIIKGFLGITGSVALVMFIYGGITWLTSAGSPDKIKKGKDIFLWSVVGLFIIFGSYLMVDFVITRLTSEGVGGSCVEQANQQKTACSYKCDLEAKDDDPKFVKCLENCVTGFKDEIAKCPK